MSTVMLSWQYFNVLVHFDELIVLALVLLVKGSPTIFNARATSWALSHMEGNQFATDS